MFDAEANIQAEFYHQCKLIGLECRLEVTTPVGRLDAVILAPGLQRVLAIVEVKREAASFEQRQIERYKTLGVPVYGLKNAARALKLAATIKAKHADDLGIT